MSEVDKHYQTVPGEQHHARAIRLGLNWYQGNITKYAERAPHKGSQSDDLTKVIDYATLWLESSPTKLRPDQQLKLRLIAERLNKLGGNVSGAKQADPRVPRNYPGDGPVEEGAADSRYTDQDHARARGNAGL